MKKTLFTLFICCFTSLIYGQTTVFLDNDINNTTISTCNAFFYDEGGALGDYSAAQNRVVTFKNR
jgi:hypothetical protein